jgi:hypothetical protein
MDKNEKILKERNITMNDFKSLKASLKKEE